MALWQANYVADALRRHDPELSVQLQHIVTQGDKILDVPLARIGGKGLFTTELERRLLDGTIDLAVHSLKDLPADVPDGLCLAAITAATTSTTPSFPTVCHPGIPAGRRLHRHIEPAPQAQLLHTRPDLVVSDLRGNVDTRLKKLDDGQYDAIILAEAGLQRLGRADRICQLLPVTTMIPASARGPGHRTRADDMSLGQALAFLNDQDTAAAATARTGLPGRHQRQLPGSGRRLRHGPERDADLTEHHRRPRRQPGLPHDDARSRRRQRCHRQRSGLYAPR